MHWDWIGLKGSAVNTYQINDRSYCKIGHVKPQQIQNNNETKQKRVFYLDINLIILHNSWYAHIKHSEQS